MFGAFYDHPPARYPTTQIQKLAFSPPVLNMNNYPRIVGYYRTVVGYYRTKVRKMKSTGQGRFRTLKIIKIGAVFIKLH